MILHFSGEAVQSTMGKFELGPASENYSDLASGAVERLNYGRIAETGADGRSTANILIRSVAIFTDEPN